MPKKYQNPKLEVRRDVAQPYYFIRVSVPRIHPETGKRVLARVEKRLGIVGQTAIKEGHHGDELQHQEDGGSTERDVGVGQQEALQGKLPPCSQGASMIISRPNTSVKNSPSR